MIYLTFSFIFVFGGLGYLTRSAGQRLVAAGVIGVTDIVVWRLWESRIMIAGTADRGTLEAGYWMILGLILFGTYAVFGLGRET